MGSTEWTGLGTITSQGSLGRTDIGNSMRKHRLWWFGVVMRQVEEDLLLSRSLVFEGRRGRGGPKPIWVQLIQADLRATGVDETLAQNKRAWKMVIWCVSLNCYNVTT